MQHAFEAEIVGVVVVVWLMRDVLGAEGRDIEVVAEPDVGYSHFGLWAVVDEPVAVVVGVVEAADGLVKCESGAVWMLYPSWAQIDDGSMT